MLRTVVIAAIAITVTTPNIGHFQNSTNDGQKAVLVTGASTGIGRKLTERLAAMGTSSMRPLAKRPICRRLRQSRTYKACGST